jgi:2-amino-4-hydroxy-6-hydroxymethyldihydropteridine diphosphokinase
VTVHRAYLALGSNVDPERHYPAALRLLAGLGRVAAVSPVYETVAVGMPGAANFLNGAVLLETGDPPETCKGRLSSEIEEALGRERPDEGRWLARSIDVDIALWDDLVGEILGRPVPDPAIAVHLHLARPLADLAPDLVLPGDGRTLAAVAAALARRGGPLPSRRPDIKLDA